MIEEIKCFICGKETLENVGRTSQGDYIATCKECLKTAYRIEKLDGGRQ